jgi:hypothetical protein
MIVILFLAVKGDEIKQSDLPDVVRGGRLFHNLAKK